MIRKYLAGLRFRGERIVRNYRRKRWLGISETGRCRPRLAPFCTGYGVDLGFGGDPITPHAIRVDLPVPYTHLDDYPVQLGGSASDLYWFQDESLDFVYSSHLLEDFADTKSILAEWLRVLKLGGHLVIFCPDEQQFRRHCERTGQPYNTAHHHEFFSLSFVQGLLAELGQTDIVHIVPEVDYYSWDLVIRKRNVTAPSG